MVRNWPRASSEAVMFVDGREKPELLKDLIRDAPVGVAVAGGAQPPTVRVFALR